MKKLVTILAVTALVISILTGALAVVCYNKYKEDSEKYKDVITMLRSNVEEMKKASKEVTPAQKEAEEALAQAEKMTPGKFNTCLILAVVAILLALASTVSLFMNNPTLTMGAGGALILITVVTWVLVPSIDTGKYGGAGPQTIAIIHLIPSVLGGALAIVRKRMA